MPEKKTPRKESSLQRTVCFVTVVALVTLQLYMSSQQKYGSPDLDFNLFSLQTIVSSSNSSSSELLPLLQSLKDEVAQLKKEEYARQKELLETMKEPYPADFIPLPDESIKDFERQEGVVIVTKIHWEKTNKHLASIKQSLCLLHKAYNHRVNYDIIIFSTFPVSVEGQQQVRDTVYPSKVTFAVDHDGIPSLVGQINEDAQQRLFKRCNVSSVKEMDFETLCEEDGNREKVAYNWQAEFRALHLWKRKELEPYKYMMWIDSDAFIFNKWEKDPVATAIREKLALFFANFPMGYAKGPTWPDRIQRAFNRSICRTRLKDGYLHAVEGDCPNPIISQVHGFFHISNLDFFRSPPVAKWLEILIGEEKFSRRYDDQVAVTLPAAVLAPFRSKQIRNFGINLNMYHNTFNFTLDQNRCDINFRKFWRLYGNSTFPEAYGVCEVKVAV